MSTPSPLPSLGELIDGVFFGVQSEPDAGRRARLHNFGMLLFDLQNRRREAQFNHWLGHIRQLAERGYVRLVERS